MIGEIIACVVGAVYDLGHSASPRASMVVAHRENTHPVALAAADQPETIMFDFISTARSAPYGRLSANTVR
jgi:hypothetical protein